jgi:LuxR family maltose regulon positive regulatory protein
VIRVYFAQRRWTEAVELLDGFRAYLDRPANIDTTITYLSQSLVALHQTGQSEQARGIAERLLTLTEPEGYLRAYLDEGEPMRQTLLALLTLHSQQHEVAASTTAYIAKLLAAFEQEQQAASTSAVAAPTPARQALTISSAPSASLTHREQEILRLLAAGASNQDIAQTLVIALSTVKKHVGNLLGKLGAASRTQAVARARALSLL